MEMVKTMKWVSSESVDILSFLKQNTTFSVKQLKQFLKFKNIYVNQNIVTNVHFCLKNGDIIELIEMKTDSNLSILYEDKDLIIVDKPTNLLTIASSKEKEQTLYYMVSNYIKKNHKQGKIFVVHRLDKDTSGIVIFAKNEKVKQMLQDNWNDVHRYYMAIVHGKIEKQQDTLKTYLIEDKYLNVKVSTKGKLAITEYIVEKSNQKYSLLNIQIYTGRKHQIRFQLQEIHHPIVGDKKYGMDDHQKRLYLHANKLIFVHPITHKTITIMSPIPVEFHKLIK